MPSSRRSSVSGAVAAVTFAPAVLSALEAWELALEAWVDLRAQGYIVEERRVRESLFAIASRVPKQNGAQVGGRSEHAQLFAPAPDGGPPVFLTLLRPQSGMVHFLYFWKAFSEAMHMAGAQFDQGLVIEIEVLRDRLLRRIDEKLAAAQVTGGAGANNAGSGSSGSSSSTDTAPPSSTKSPVATEGTMLPTWALVEEVHRAAGMSAYPRFWQRVSDTLTGQLELEELSMEELTSVLLSWLHESQLWEQQEKEHIRRSSSVTSDNSPSPKSGLPVHVHIYDVSQEVGIQKLNRWLAHTYSPLKFGGIFHAGVEVNGLEWSYGFSPCASRPGVACIEPRTHPQHHYRQTVVLRHTELPPERIAEIISELVEEYPGYDYDLLRRNCCHFADEFCRRLGVGGIPSWVHRLARLGAGVDTLLQNAPRPIKERVYG